MILRLAAIALTALLGAAIGEPQPGDPLHEAVDKRSQRRRLLVAFVTAIRQSPGAQGRSRVDLRDNSPASAIHRVATTGEGIGDTCEPHGDDPDAIRRYRQRLSTEPLDHAIRFPLRQSPTVFRLVMFPTRPVGHLRMRRDRSDEWLRPTQRAVHADLGGRLDHLDDVSVGGVRLEACDGPVM